MIPSIYRRIEVQKSHKPSPTLRLQARGNATPSRTDTLTVLDLRVYPSKMPLSDVLPYLFRATPPYSFRLQFAV